MPPARRISADYPYEIFPWELGFIVNERLEDTGFAVVRGRLYSRAHYDLLPRLMRDHRIIGITCQGVFPQNGAIPGCIPDRRGLRESRQDGYLRVIEGWAHCFRNPADYLPPGKPWYLYSNSDATDPERLWRIGNEQGPLEKRWDFFYTCLTDPANVVRKNWDLAKRCIARFTEEMGLRGVLVGVAELPDVPQHPNLDVYPKTPWRDFLRLLGQSRVAFFPNTWDPSPRVMAEAMCLDVPVLVNHEILGGWKYVTPSTGAFFLGEFDVVEAMSALRSRDLAPRDWFSRFYGPEHAGRRLAEFLYRIDPEAAGLADIERASFFSPRDYRAYPRQRGVAAGALARSSAD